MGDRVSIQFANEDMEWGDKSVVLFFDVQNTVLLSLAHAARPVVFGMVCSNTFPVERFLK